LPKSLLDSLMKAKVDRVLDTRTSSRSKPSQATPRKDDSPMTIEKKFAEMENKFKRRG